MEKIFNGLEKFANVQIITKGWSGDDKYCVTTASGERYFLRIFSTQKHETQKALFHILEELTKRNIPMCMPVEFGPHEGSAYMLQSWIDGEDLEEILPLLPETEQYVLGLKSGEIARQIHSIPAPEAQEDWVTRFNRKTDNKIKKYQECPLRFEGDEQIIAYIEENRHLLENRPQCFQHGDYHVGNMMLENGKLKVVDFDRYDFGGPLGGI